MPSKKSAGQRSGGAAAAPKKKFVEKTAAAAPAVAPAVQSKGAPVPTPSVAAPNPAAAPQEVTPLAPAVAAPALAAAQAQMEPVKVESAEMARVPSSGSNSFFEAAEDDDQPASSLAAKASSAQPPQQEEAEEFHEALEGDMDDPLSMLGGMGQEELYKVTAVLPTPVEEGQKHEGEAAQLAAEDGQVKVECEEAQQVECPEKNETNIEQGEAKAEEVEEAQVKHVQVEEVKASVDDVEAMEVKVPQSDELEVDKVKAGMGEVEEVRMARELAETAEEERKAYEVMLAMKQDNDASPLRSTGGVQSSSAAVAAELNDGLDSEGGATRTGGTNTPNVHSQAGSHSDLASADLGTPRKCHVSVVCDSTKPGECLALIGEDPALGSWDTQKVVQLTTSAESFPTWSADIPAPAAGSQFKLVITRGNGDVSWEPIDGNRTWPSGALSGPIASYGK